MKFGIGGVHYPQAEGLQKAQISAWAGEALRLWRLKFIFDLPGHIDRIRNNAFIKSSS